MEPQVVERKLGVLITEAHWDRPMARLIHAFCGEWPVKSTPVTITRGCETCPNGYPMSKHLFPVCKAFDFRARSLPKDINRQLIVDRVLDRLGIAEYYGYYKKLENGIEWFHFQYNG